MAKEIFPSSYKCDCGHQSDFGENTIREIKNMSRYKKVRISDSEKKSHTIVFYNKKAIEMICPKLGNQKIIYNIK